MDAPKCKICGERHYGLCVDPRGRGEPNLKRALDFLLRDKPKPEVAASPGKFDREAYQRNYMREYMRKKRAAKKAQAEKA